MSIEYRKGERITVDIDSETYMYGEQLLDDWNDVAYVADKFNSLLDQIEKPREPKTIEDYYNEWQNAITELSEKEEELSLIKEEYNEKEFDVVFINSEGVDFKELYGSTSEKVRKQHASMKLQTLADAKTDLELSIDYLKRRIDFIKSIMAMQRTLISSGVLENEL